MEAVETTIPANTPVVLQSETEVNETFYNNSVDGTPTAGLLTGVYKNTKATAGTYVLQNNNDKVAFYKVVADAEPTVGANRCYLTIPALSARAAFFFPGSEVTGIKAVKALTSGKAQIFNASGAQIPALQKGLNIIRMEDGTTQKVMVE